MGRTSAWELSAATARARWRSCSPLGRAATAAASASRSSGTRSGGCVGVVRHSGHTRRPRRCAWKALRMQPAQYE